MFLLVYKTLILKKNTYTLTERLVFILYISLHLQNEMERAFYFESRYSIF